MVQKFEGFKSKQGKLFLSEEAATRSEVLENLCEIIPEFQMVRPRLEANLDAIAAAVGPMLDFRRRVPSKGPIVDPLAENPAEVLRRIAEQQAEELGLTVDHESFDMAARYCAEKDHGELAGTCDCSAGMNGASDHARSCPSYRPVAGLALAHG